MFRIRIILIVYGFILILSCTQKDRVKNKSFYNKIGYENLNKSKSNKLDIAERLMLINESFEKIKLESPDSISLAIISQKGNLHYLKKEKDSAFYCDKLLLKTSSSINSYAFAGKAHFNIALYFKSKGIYDSAFYHYNQSKNNYLKVADFSQVGRRFLSMGVIQQNKSDYFGSKETVTEALSYLQKDNDVKFMASAYSILATNHRKLLNHSDAIDYYSQAIKITNSEKDKLIYSNNLAATYIDNGQYDQAISLLQKIANDSILIRNKKEYARVLDNLIYAQWHNGNFPKTKDFLESLKIRQQNNDKRGLISSYTHLGEFYIEKNTKIAESYFDSVRQLSKTIQMPRAEKDALKFLMQLQPQNVGLRDRYVSLQDSLYEQELKVKTQFAKYKYDDKLKQEDILRLEKEKVENELEVTQQRNLKISSYAIGGLLLLISSFVTYFFVQRSKRLKQQNKTARLEANFETEAELSRKLHDDFGGKLNHAMLLLQSESNREEVLNIVDGLYNQSRDFSREINDVDTGPNFKDFLFGMMGNYSKHTRLIVSGSTEVNWLRISPLSKKTLFKVLQELMINMQKHSNATLVSFAFKQTKKMIKITYTDDGAGASNEALNLKNGLWNTEKRIEAIGGTIIFDSEKGQGFETRIEIPN
ncbi:hypothetical protein [Maribacter sp. 4G9]|uniref:tetratricopeptide repeat-containing sensor histidine kinase n=1 Tax=Maribacter sp. 4G9 TaxID=1889777 RepID=UPI000C144A31|nr:hypothetical protein [Maribacter sp. 4G9]PIB38306.1 hypothetical protein BFP75_17120 [Maribacter sp. 4G9]